MGDTTLQEAEVISTALLTWELAFFLMPMLDMAHVYISYRLTVITFQKEPTSILYS